MTVRVALVTGGASGIGRACALRLACDGLHVVVADRASADAERVAAEIAEQGGAAAALALDVTDASTVDAAFAGLDRLDVLVCAAGLLRMGTAPETDLETWNEVLAVNLNGAFLCARAGVVAMRAGEGGSIVLVSSSTGAHDALPGAVAYVASKGGVTLLARAMAVDHAAEGIRVNAVAPGPVDTPMLQGALDAAERQAFGATLPIGRLGASAEIAAVVSFLASGDASFVTGAVVAADGGQTATV